MRLQVGDGNPLSRRAVVLLDGVVQKTCIMADEEQGVVERYVENRCPTWSWPTETVRGRVRIVDPESLQTIHDAYTRCDR